MDSQQIIPTRLKVWNKYKMSISVTRLAPCLSIIVEHFFCRIGHYMPIFVWIHLTKCNVFVSCTDTWCSKIKNCAPVDSTKGNTIRLLLSLFVKRAKTMHQRRLKFFVAHLKCASKMSQCSALLPVCMYVSTRRSDWLPFWKVGFTHKLSQRLLSPVYLYDKGFWATQIMTNSSFCAACYQCYLWLDNRNTLRVKVSESKRAIKVGNLKIIFRDCFLVATFIHVYAPLQWSIFRDVNAFRAVKVGFKKKEKTIILIVGSPMHRTDSRWLGGQWQPISTPNVSK